jgi:hypothetical protein
MYMARSRRSLPKNNQESKRLKVKTLLKASVSRLLTIAIAEVSERTYYRIKDDMKRKRTWLRKKDSGRKSKLKKN